MFVQVNLQYNEHRFTTTDAPASAMHDGSAGLHSDVISGVIVAAGSH